jgi:hypothetical protein
MRNFLFSFAANVVVLILAVTVVVLAARPRRETAASQAAVMTSDIPPDTFQEAVSMHEERREVIDFLVAPPELIQQSLKGRKVLIYDQN